MELRCSEIFKLESELTRIAGFNEGPLRGVATRTWREWESWPEVEEDSNLTSESMRLCTLGGCWSCRGRLEGGKAEGEINPRGRGRSQGWIEGREKAKEREGEGIRKRARARGRESGGRGRSGLGGQRESE